jgi:hypothetical protein
LAGVVWFVIYNIPHTVLVKRICLKRRAWCSAIQAKTLALRQIPGFFCCDAMSGVCAMREIPQPRIEANASCVWACGAIGFDARQDGFTRN